MGVVAILYIISFKTLEILKNFDNYRFSYSNMLVPLSCAVYLLASESKYTKPRSHWLWTRKLDSLWSSVITWRENLKPYLCIVFQMIPCPYLTYSRIASIIGSSLVSSICTSSYIQTTAHPPGLEARSSCSLLWHCSSCLSTSTWWPISHCAIWGNQEALREVSHRDGASSGSAALTIGGSSFAGYSSLSRVDIQDVSFIKIDHSSTLCFLSQSIREKTRYRLITTLPYYSLC